MQANAGKQNFLANLPVAMGGLQFLMAYIFCHLVWKGGGNAPPLKWPKITYLFRKKGQRCTPFNPKISFF